MFRAETLGTKQDIRNHSEAPTSGASTICRRNSKMKERNIELFKQSQLGLDDTFKFHCTMCGRCCINREDILLPPRDLYAMAKELNFTSKEFFDKYCEVFIGSDTRIPVVRLKPVGSVKRCPLLKDRRCSVHQAKPTVCALFPIGRFMLSEKSEGKLTKQKTGYFFVNPGCGDDSETQTVRDWLNAFGIPLEDPFFKVWQDALINLSMEMQRIKKSVGGELMDDIWSMVFWVMYIDYDMKKDFMEQFTEKQYKMIALLKALPLPKGGKK